VPIVVFGPEMTILNIKGGIGALSLFIITAIIVVFCMRAF